MTTKELCESLNLFETSSQRQLSNGTRQFLDEETDTLYISYSSGYVRRAISNKNQYRKYLYGRDQRTYYQLNKKVCVLDIQYNVKRWIRIMEIDYSKRLEMIERAVINYRKNNL